MTINTSCIRCKWKENPDNARYEGMACTNPTVLERYNADTGRTLSRMYIDQARPMFCRGGLFEETELAKAAAVALAQDKLLPCPFCGGTNIDPHGWMKGGNTLSPEFGPECEGCGATAASVGVWNTRPAQTEQQPVAYRILRKRADGLWVADGRSWTDGVPDSELLDDIANRSDGWRLIYAYAAPAHPAARQDQGEVQRLRQALEPFAAIADAYDPAEADDHRVWVDAQSIEHVRLPLRAFRAARAALAASTGQSADQAAPTDPLTATAHIPVAQLLDIRHALVKGAHLDRLFLLAELLEKAIARATGKPFAEVQG